MTADYRSWSGPARTMALSVDAAVSAALAGDRTAFQDALAELGRVDAEQLSVLLGSITRDLLERAHPDGLDSDDAEQVLQRCARAAEWYPALDSDALIWALTGALGVSDPDAMEPIAASVVLAHGLLVIADLLTTVGLDLPGVLDPALRELMRAQTVELP